MAIVRFTTDKETFVQMVREAAERKLNMEQFIEFVGGTVGDENDEKIVRQDYNSCLTKRKNEVIAKATAKAKADGKSMDGLLAYVEEQVKKNLAKYKLNLKKGRRATELFDDIELDDFDSEGDEV